MEFECPAYRHYQAPKTTEGPETLPSWAFKEPPPKIGTKVTILAWDSHPTGTVVGYTVSHGWLMINVKPEYRPLWHIIENPDRDICLFAGIELEWER
jgi:hypothetical protein